jgi:hypothetical protein
MYPSDPLHVLLASDVSEPDRDPRPDDNGELRELINALLKLLLLEGVLLLLLVTLPPLGT